MIFDSREDWTRGVTWRALKLGACSHVPRWSAFFGPRDDRGEKKRIESIPPRDNP